MNISNTILVVDDDPMLVNLVKECLQDAGHNVVTADDGQTALELARIRRPNLIIMDVVMPRTSGLKAFEQMRDSESTQRIPVIFLSGVTSDWASNMVKDAEGVVYLKKPLDLESLKANVHQLLVRYSPLQAFLESA